jgi:type I restriction enzyme M protein
LEAPDIDPANALRFRLSEIGEKDRMDVILTNPPFGGEEERGILSNFPDDRRTNETALLFLQLIMRRLKRGGRGRAGVVVPNGFLFGDGVVARIKAELLTQFNLHTIVRLPEGVFAPYTDISTNLVFLDTSGPTNTIAYWEQPMPVGRRKYSKTQPLQFDEMAACVAWWKDRAEGPLTWTLDFATRKAEALQRAEPLWAEARAHEQRTRELNEQARRPGGAERLVKAAAEQARLAAEKQRAGDAAW